jgi:hypothetical protein
MKKLLTIVAVASGMAVQTYGQGTVTFAALNITNSLTPGVLAVSGTTFKIALYWLPDGTAPTTPDFDVPTALAYTTNLSLAGGVQAGIVRIEGINPSGAPAWFQIRAWENVVNGDNWAQAVTRTVGARGALAGTSNIGRIDTGDPTTTPPGTAPNTAATLKGFTLYPVVPEPSTIGLGILGIASLLLLRRRS